MKSNRREFFETIGVGAAGVAVGAGILSSASCGSPENKEENEQILLIGDNIAVADTQYGKVRGYRLRGIYYFLGIPYGADTSGGNRVHACSRKPCESECYEDQIKPCEAGLQTRTYWRYKAWSESVGAETRTHLALLSQNMSNSLGVENGSGWIMMAHIRLG